MAPGRVSEAGFGYWPKRAAWKESMVVGGERTMDEDEDERPWCCESRTGGGEACVRDADMTGVETGVVSGVIIPSAEFETDDEEVEKTADWGGVARRVEEVDSRIFIAIFCSAKMSPWPSPPSDARTACANPASIMTVSWHRGFSHWATSRSWC